MASANSQETQIPARPPAFLSPRVNNVLVDFYQCPESLEPLSLLKELPRQSADFHLGPGAMVTDKLLTAHHLRNCIARSGDVNRWWRERRAMKLPICFLSTLDFGSIGRLKDMVKREECP